MIVYPVNLNIKDKKCIVVGGGNVAERKVKSLLRANAAVNVISPNLTPTLQDLVMKKKVNYIARNYQAGDIKGCFLVICATDNKEINKTVAEEADALGLLFNVIDDSKESNFTVPAVIKRADLILTVSTNGKSPAVSRQIKEELSQMYGDEYGSFLKLIAKYRQELKYRVKNSKERENFWRENMNKDILTLLKDGRLNEAEAKIKDAIGSFGAKS